MPSVEHNLVAAQRNQVGVCLTAYDLNLVRRAEPGSKRVWLPRSGTRLVSLTAYDLNLIEGRNQVQKNPVQRIRLAPTYVDAYQLSSRLEIFTTSPVCGACTNSPPPM